MTNCPCHSCKSYELCCEKYHLEKSIPETAEQLMRSRYSAFVMKNADYLVKTHAPKTRSAKLEASLIQTFANTTWLGLEVLTTNKGQKQDREGHVLFKATYLSGGQLSEMRENSFFVKFKRRWYYEGALSHS